MSGSVYGILMAAAVAWGLAEAYRAQHWSTRTVLLGVTVTLAVLYYRG